MSRSIPTLTTPPGSPGVNKNFLPNARWPGKFCVVNGRGPGTESPPNSWGPGLKSKDLVMLFIVLKFLEEHDGFLIFLIFLIYYVLYYILIYYISYISNIPLTNTCFRVQKLLHSKSLIQYITYLVNQQIALRRYENRKSGLYDHSFMVDHI